MFWGYFDEYISKYDVIFWDFDSSTMTEENHIWGPGIVHYQKEFYEKRLKELLQLHNKMRQ